VCSLELRWAQWEFLDGEVVQYFALWICAAPTLPGRQKVQAGSKSGFLDGEGRIFKSSPLLRQFVPSQEYVAAFREAVGAGVINILKPL
jgi:hypothetical protein